MASSDTSPSGPPPPDGTVGGGVGLSGLSVSGIAAVLAPLRERYRHWLGLSDAQVRSDREEAADDVRAMPLILRMERSAPPSWHAALAAAASAAASICLDPRAAPDGPWHDAVADYCAGHIRKVTRRARGAHWAAVQDLPGVTIDLGGTEVRALLPGRVAELDSRVSRLQVGGTDAPVDPAPDWAQLGAADPAAALQLWLPSEPAMTLGKSMAQAGHAGMIAAALLSGPDTASGDAAVLDSWAAAGYPTVTQGRTADWSALSAAVAAADGWSAQRLVAVRDAGFTEIPAGTITVIARAPGR
ncbi:hypothetical protein FDO65_06755 [Nakamurella flava]|uniref:peptidyl-tRNA hydrolase n=1 Tax=Nakamurella flava TaxID=2576308 RepID=A0A4U6QLW6_9ACTN|nr:peptidyl-tRNA hydrolase [Nakamurella flava]TKV61299.1 hypothetical protein FDO65_06755 [Nakamurella flava]